MINILIGLIIICLTIIFDHTSKVLALAYLKESVPHWVIKDFFAFRLEFNDGAAFSSFSGNFWLLMGMTVIATIVFIILARKAKFNDGFFYALGIYLMIGGMLGNFFDRVFFKNHEVVDMISFVFGGHPFATFNLADSFLVVGTILLLIDILFLENRRERKKFNA